MIFDNYLKIKGLINIANKAGYLIIGTDSLKVYKKKLYLILMSNDAGSSTIRNANFVKQDTNCEIITLTNDVFNKVVNIKNCKIIAIKNKGLAEEIKKYLRGENIG